MSEIHKCLLHIQNSLKAPKSQFNNFGKYHYRNCEDILEAVKPLAYEVGCTVRLTDKLVQIGDRYYIEATAGLYDGENSIETTAYAREEQEKKGMDGSQVTGASSSYARKYALNGLFAIDDAKDSDHTKGKEDLKEPEPKKPTEVKKPWLNPGDQNWKNAVEALAGKVMKKDGSPFVLKDIELKYQMTTETKEKLLNDASNGA